MIKSPFTEPTRLKIMTALAVAKKPLTFNVLIDQLGLTRGNFSINAGKLEDLKFIKIEKTFEGKKPKTTYRITKEGKEELMSYIQSMEDIFKTIKDK